MKTFTVEEAAKSFGAVAQIAFSGEPVLLVGSEGELVLKSADETSDAVPMRPPGYFDDVEDKGEADQSNRIAARAPKKIVR